MDLKKLFNRFNEIPDMTRKYLVGTIAICGSSVLDEVKINPEEVCLLTSKEKILAIMLRAELEIPGIEQLKGKMNIPGIEKTIIIPLVKNSVFYDVRQTMIDKIANIKDGKVDISYQELFNKINNELNLMVKNGMILRL